MSAAVVLQQMIIIFLLVIVGYGCTKAGVLTPHASKDLSALVVNICNPALMLTSVWESQSEISLEQLGVAAVLGVCLYALLVVLGFLVPRIVHAPVDKRSHYNMMTIFGNVGFVGYPVIRAVLGASGVIYAVVFNMCFMLLVYTYGRTLVVKGSEAAGRKFQFRDLINVGAVTCVLCIVLFATKLTFPPVITQTIAYMGNATTFLSLIVIGVNLARNSLRDILGDVHIYLFILVRQILIPVLIGFMIRPLIQDELLYGVTVLVMAMPVGSITLMMAEEARVDTDAFSKGIVVSTMLSVITIPLVVAFV